MDEIQQIEIRLNLNEYADLPFLKKLFSQLKGIASVEIVEEDKTYSWEEIESSEAFKKLIEQREKDFEEGRYVEHSKELLDAVFRKSSFEN